MSDVVREVVARGVAASDTETESAQLRARRVRTVTESDTDTESPQVAASDDGAVEPASPPYAGWPYALP